jgi:hypothetical protein
MKTHIFILLVAISTVSIAQNSILFDASDQQYLTISNADDRFNATADFTYEIWVKFTSKGFDGKRLAPFFGGQQSDYAALIDNKIGMRLNSNGVCSGDRTFGNTSTIDTDTWYHIAYVRSGSVVSLYLDGTLLGTTECSQEDGSVKGVWMINANTINIGAIFWNTSYLDGYIGGMRYVVGAALYSGDFTPQLGWEKTNETILLMNIKNEGAAFTDESDYSNTINVNGSSSSPTFVAGNGPILPADILLSGDVSIENNSIKNVADPVYAQDAATKNYVDNAGIQGATGPQGPAGPQGLAGADGEAGTNGTNGSDGADGNGIASTTDNNDGTFTLTFDDATTFTTSDLTGPTGATGAQGPTGATGAAGTNGTNGSDGADGNGIAFTTDNNDGTFTLTFDDATTFTTSDLTGPTGATGAQGPTGATGAAGTNGTNGSDGADGNGIASTTDNNDGTFTLTFDDATTFTTSDLTGPTGDSAISYSPAVEPNIGDEMLGGVVAYILQSTDPGYEEGKVKGLIAAANDFSNGGTYTFTNVDPQSAPDANVYNNSSELIGSGQANTDLFVASTGGVGDYAPVHANNYSVIVDGVNYDDWYLPSRNELKKLYANRSAIGNFTTTGTGLSEIYQSSSSYPTDNRASFFVRFSDGWSNFETQPYRVRFVRSFTLQAQTSITVDSFVGDLAGNASSSSFVKGGTAGQIMISQGTSTPTWVSPGTSGNVLTSDGSTWISQTIPSNGIETVNGITNEIEVSTSNTTTTIGLPDNTTISTSLTVNGLYFGNSSGGGNDNLAIGSQMGSGTGHRNTALGKQALDSYAGTSFDNNTAVGYYNLRALTTGSGNTGLGAENMFSLTTGSSNTGVGNQTMLSVTTGNQNTGLGQRAGQSITTGSNNTLLGFNANVSSGSANNETVIGQNTTGAGDNTVTLGNINVTDVYMAQDSGATIHAADLNLGGTAVTATATEMNYLNGVTSNLQTQIDALNSGGVTTYSVGDIAQGGKVFWVDTTGQHGLVVALEDAGGSSAMDWNAGTASSGLNLETLAQSSGIYAGRMNTAIIIAAHAAAANNGNNFAARACNEYSYTQNGVEYADWYLPSKEELHLIKTSGVGAPNLYSYNYWSSTEYDSNNAYAEVLSNYANNYDQHKPKDTAEAIKVRAIRSF